MALDRTVIEGSSDKRRVDRIGAGPAARFAAIADDNAGSTVVTDQVGLDIRRVGPDKSEEVTSGLRICVHGFPFRTVHILGDTVGQVGDIEGWRNLAGRDGGCRHDGCQTAGEDTSRHAASSLLQPPPHRHGIP
jgi:hypothetical protein